jgi:phosphoglycerate dehydrogenase-like enzyme
MATAPAPVLLSTAPFARDHRGDVDRIVRAAGAHLELAALDAGGPLLGEDLLARVDVAFLPGGGEGDPLTRRFFGAVLRAPHLRWLHLGFVGLDHPVFRRIAERGVRLSNSPGASAEAIALTALAGLLALARGLPRWAEAQRRKEWSPTPPQDVPRDLCGQTLLVLGLGAIGSHLARFAGALGLRVIGVRRSARRPDDPVHELHPPSALGDLLPRADWLAITCPLTAQTRGLIDERALRRLPRGARLLNVARGAIVDEGALVRVLAEGHLAGAYLDVFEREPLPPESPLWELAGVLVTPHDSHVSQGNAARATELFLDNLARWLRGEPLRHEVAFEPAAAR